LLVYLGIDLGGTNLRVALREPGCLDPSCLRVDLSAASSRWAPPDLISAINAALDRIGTPRGITGIGFAITGDPNPDAGTCHAMTRFPALERFPLAAYLTGQFRAPARVLNDGLSNTLGELRMGAGRGVRDFVMITLGTGVGGGVVIDGRLVTRKQGRFGKIGHQIVDIDGPVHCHCGLPGCWQSFAGKAGVVARAHEAVERDPSSALANALPPEGTFDLRLLGELADAGDLAARQVVDEVGRFVGVGLANLVKLLACDLAIIGGGIAQACPGIIPAAQQALTEYAVLEWQRIPVVPAALGIEAGVAGATFLAEGLPNAQRPTPNA
jgi:glucokinase